ncbi:MAG: hypothetical protein KA144_08540 [Xanthomonadaceae bacterium]|nr:hypothetical protein [Xanthomonadaceae bacterium]
MSVARDVGCREYDSAGFVEILLVSAAGIGVLAGTVWWLSQYVVGR